jgi:hypothetical protein
MFKLIQEKNPKVKFVSSVEHNDQTIEMDSVA